MSGYMIQNYWFADETFLELQAPFNPKNNVFYARENSGGPADNSDLWETVSHPQKLHIYIAMHSKLGIIALEINENVTAESHRRRLEYEIVPEMKRRAELANMPFENFGYLEDGAPAHASHEVSDFLFQTFQEKVVAGKYERWHGCGLDWPPHSPDLNPPDTFLNSYLKERTWQSCRIVF